MISDPTPSQPAAPMRAAIPRWLKWVLIASLAFNLLIVGGAIGHRVFGGPAHWRGGQEDFGIMGYVRKLDGERRAELRKVVQADRGEQAELKRAVVRARIAVGEELAREPFDRQKLEAALAAFRDAEARLKLSGVTTLIRAAEQMTVAERQGLVDWWKRRRPRHFREPPEDGGKDR
jgi:uncharacterized membrane protein